jgi:GTPase
MIPIIAIVGRPNVGKSTLFNQLTKTRRAIVADEPGLTRDRQYGRGQVGTSAYMVVDTGGIGEITETIDEHLTSQAMQAIEECDVIFFMIDLRAGVSAADQRIADELRKYQKKLYLVANKADGVDVTTQQADCFQLGLGSPIPIAAAHGRGIKTLIEQVEADFPASTSPPVVTAGIKFAIVGRPNVGKSTLVNRILGEERVVVFDEPGTTRDSIHIEFTRHNKAYTIIDTAGVRRRARVNRGVEKFSVVKTLAAIEESNVVVLVIDGRETVTEQDLHLLGCVIEAGKALVVAVNKWDGLSATERERLRYELDRRLIFAQFAERYFISALHGSSVGDLFPAIERAYQSATRRFSTPQVNTALQAALEQHAPPLIRGRRVKIRYAHAGGSLPPLIVLHGNQLESLSKNYLRFLTNYFREKFDLIGTPIRFELKTTDNPFKGRKNVLTERQQRKRRRMLRHVKQKKS